MGRMTLGQFLCLSLNKDSWISQNSSITFLNCALLWWNEGEALQPRTVGEPCALTRPYLSFGKACMMVLCMCMSFLSAGLTLVFPCQKYFCQVSRSSCCQSGAEGVYCDRVILWYLQILLEKFMRLYYGCCFTLKNKIIFILQNIKFFRIFLF